MLDKIKEQLRTLEYDFIISGRKDIKLEKNIKELKNIVKELEPKLSFTHTSEMKDPNLEYKLFEAFTSGKLRPDLTFSEWYKMNK